MHDGERHMRRVVVTGLGLVTPLGADVETAWSNLIAAKSGADTICNAAIFMDSIAVAKIT